MGILCPIQSFIDIASKGWTHVISQAQLCQLRFDFQGCWAWIREQRVKLFQEYFYGNGRHIVGGYCREDVMKRGAQTESLRSVSRRVRLGWRSKTEERLSVNIGRRKQPVTPGNSLVWHTQLWVYMISHANSPFPQGHEEWSSFSKLVSRESYI